MVFSICIYFSRPCPNYGFADPPLLRSGYLDIKDAQWAKKKWMVQNFISHHIAFVRHRRPKGAFWEYKNWILGAQNAPFGRLWHPNAIWSFTPIFIFNTLRIFHVKLVTSEGGGEVCIFLVGNNRAFDPISNEASNLTSRISDKKFVCLLKNSQEKRNFPLFSIGNKKLKALLNHVRMKQQLEGREKPTKIS